MSLPFKSKKEVVYDQLRQEILEGVHPPGSRLVIDEQAIRLGVSQIPIREAVRQLEADGFVTIAPHVGATVTDLDASFIYEVFALLESMEVICGRMACSSITNLELAQLKQMVMEMDQLTGNPTEWSLVNKRFHIKICQIARTDLVMAMTLKVFDHWDRLRYRYLKDVLGHRTHEAQKEHHQILEVLEQRDPDAVEEIIRLHNQRALKSYINYLQAQGVLGA